MVMLEVQEKWQQFTAQDAKAQELKLKETLTRAGSSPLYRKLWKTSHFTPDTLQSLNDLNQLPYLTRKTLFETTRAKPNKICIAPVSQWFLGYDQPNTHEWYPYSGEDFRAIAPMLARMSRTAGLRKGDIVLAIVDTPPRISSFIPYLWSQADASRACGLEFIIGSMEWYDTLGMSWINFIQKRHPTAIFSSRKNALVLAEKLGTMNSSVREVLSEARIGIFYGEHTADITQHVEPYSALETFEVYSPTEHMAFWPECRSHSGVHVWLDTCIPEIIPIGHEEAQLLRKAASGTKGELVITNFSEALPLIRYKTGEIVSVESIDGCSCGCDHPRIKFHKK